MFNCSLPTRQHVHRSIVRHIIDNYHRQLFHYISAYFYHRLRLHRIVHILYSISVYYRVSISHSSISQSIVVYSMAIICMHTCKTQRLALLYRESGPNIFFLYLMFFAHRSLLVYTFSVDNVCVTVTLSLVSHIDERNAFLHPSNHPSIVFLLIFSRFFVNNNMFFRSSVHNRLLRVESLLATTSITSYPRESMGRLAIISLLLLGRRRSPQ